MKVTLVLTQRPGTESHVRLFKEACTALDAGDEVSVFVDVEGVKAMRGTFLEEDYDLSVLQQRGAEITLCRYCLMRQGLDMDPVVLATARTGDLDDLSRLIVRGERGASTIGRRVLVRIEHGYSGKDPDIGLEGLRAAVGLVRATESHAVEVVFTDDGVRWTQKGANADADTMLAQLRAARVPWYVVGAGKDDEASPAVCPEARFLNAEAFQALLDRAEIVLQY